MTNIFRNKTIFNCFFVLFTLAMFHSFGCFKADELSIKESKISLTDIWDEESPLNNPHKGLYHHYYANSTANYGKKGQDLSIIPGLKYLHLRLAWSFFEKEEGMYDWTLIDDVVNEYWHQGYKVSICITSKETDGGLNKVGQEVDGVHYAAPKWIRDAGAKGAVVDNWGVKHWEPKYDDAVYLDKLDNFISELALKYDGKPFVHCIDIGSIGEWGEGHTGFSSGIVPTPETVISHIKIFKNHFKETPIVLNDACIYWNKNEAQAQTIKTYAENNNLRFTDHSAMVEWWVKEGASKTYGINHPELFTDNYLKQPSTMECHHYKDWVKTGLWCLPNGENCEKGYGIDLLMNSILYTKATYVSFQACPDIFIRENPKVCSKIMNYAGYWYFPTELEILGNSGESGNLSFNLSWLNKGVAPAYNKYDLFAKIEPVESSANSVVTELKESDNMYWMPGKETTENYNLSLPEGLSKGKYFLKIKLQYEENSIPVHLGLKDETKDTEGFYKLAGFEIE